MNYCICNQTELCLDDEIKDLEKFIKYVTKREHIEDTYFNIIIVDNEYITKINKEYRGIDAPTDVISFALEDESSIKSEVKVLGDIYISIDKAKEQSNSYGHSLKRELSFLSIHGILHLLGYDHINQDDEKEMFDLQELILKEMNIER